MIVSLQKLVALVFAVLVLVPASVDAQGPPPANAMPYPSQPATALSQEQLEVVEAARFVQQNPGLKGEALDQALAGKIWDPSVQSLAAFPQVLAMMNDKLDWTQQLGDAFLANQEQVMQTVQSLRARAQAAGNLQSTEQQRVVVQE